MTTRYSPQIETGFSLRLLNRVCDGAGSLRDALLNEGLRPELIAFAGGVSLRTLRNATDNGRTRRGMLVRLAALAVIIEDLHSEDVPLQALRGPRTVHDQMVLDGIRARSPIAQKLLDAIEAWTPTPQTSDDEQLRFPMAA